MGEDFRVPELDVDDYLRPVPFGTWQRVLRRAMWLRLRPAMLAAVIVACFVARHWFE